MFFCSSSSPLGSSYLVTLENLAIPLANKMGRSFFLLVTELLMHFPFIASTTIFGSVCDPFFMFQIYIGQVSEFVLSRQIEAEITERQDGQQITG